MHSTIGFIWIWSSFEEFAAESNFQKEKYARAKTWKLKLAFHGIIYTYDHVHNIFRRFDSWANFLFTTSETMRDYS